MKDGNITDPLMLLRLHIVSVRQHYEWVKAQEKKGYACPVVHFQTRETLDAGRSGNRDDGLTRH